MDQLRVTLLGEFSVSYNGELLDDWGSSKAEELLCYLLLNHGRPHARELLASALWENATTTQSKAYLRKTLWQVQSVFKSRPGLSALQVLVVSPDSIQCNPDIDLWLDVDTFEMSYRDTEAISGDALSSRQIEMLCEAVELYSGDLLENLYEEWCLPERERLQHLYFSMLDKLSTYHEAHRNFEPAKSFAERILYHDRAREYTHRQLMRIRYLAGDRTGAIRQYESCARALREDLDIKPSDATTRLYEQIRTDRFSARVDDQAAALPATAPQEVISHLRTALNLLSDAQERVRKEISLLEESLLHVRR